MIEIVTPIIIISFFIIFHFYDKNLAGKEIREKYSRKAKFLLEDIKRLKFMISDLYKRNSNMKIKEELQIIENDFKINLEDKIEDFLLSIGELDEGNEYKISGLLYKLNEAVENIEQELLYIEDDINVL